MNTKSRRRNKTYLVVCAAAIRVGVVETLNRVRRQYGSDQRVGIGVHQRAHNAAHAGRLRVGASDERGEGDGEDDEESLHCVCRRFELASVDWSARRDAWDALGWRNRRIIAAFIDQSEGGGL